MTTNTTLTPAANPLAAIVENNRPLIQAFLSGEGSYEMDELIWDYYYDKGVITNYNCTDVSGLYEQFVDEVQPLMEATV
jgi:hypothetical protein